MIWAFCNDCSKRYFECKCSARQAKELLLLEMGMEFKFLDDKRYEITYYVPRWIDSDGKDHMIGEFGIEYRARDKKGAIYWSKLMGVGHDLFKGQPQWAQDCATRYPWTNKGLKILVIKEEYCLL